MDDDDGDIQSQRELNEAMVRCPCDALEFSGGAGSWWGPLRRARGVRARWRGRTHAARVPCPHRCSAAPVIYARTPSGEVTHPPVCPLAQLLDGDVVVAYAPVLPCLRAPVRNAVLFAPFKLPGGVERRDPTIKKVLGMRRRKMVPPSSGFKMPVGPATREADVAEDAEEDDAAAAVAPAAAAAAPAPTWVPLVLWRPPEGDEGRGKTPVEADGVVCKFLREHQREGVQFMVRGRGREGRGRVFAAKCAG